EERKVRIQAQLPLREWRAHKDLLVTIGDLARLDNAVGVSIIERIWKCPVPAWRVTRLVTLAVASKSEDDRLHTLTKLLYLLRQRGERKRCIPRQLIPLQQLRAQEPLGSIAAELTNVLHAGIRHANRRRDAALHDGVLHVTREVRELEPQPSLQESGVEA